MQENIGILTVTDITACLLSLLPVHADGSDLPNDTASTRPLHLVVADIDRPSMQDVQEMGI